MTYKVLIQRVSDGVERWCQHTEWKYHKDSDPWFWWVDGNARCDCNRHLFFERAEVPHFDEDVECGDDAYKVLRVELEDGTTFPGPDAPDFDRTKGV